MKINVFEEKGFALAKELIPEQSENLTASTLHQLFITNYVT